MDLELPQRRLARFLTAQGIPYVSLLPEFRAHAGQLPSLYIAGDAHWTAEGHRLAADLVAGYAIDLLTATTKAARP
jgi:hypothetical protein